MKADRPFRTVVGAMAVRETSEAEESDDSLAFQPSRETTDGSEGEDDDQNRATEEVPSALATALPRSFLGVSGSAAAALLPSARALWEEQQQRVPVTISHTSMKRQTSEGVNHAATAAVFLAQTAMIESFVQGSLYSMPSEGLLQATVDKDQTPSLPQRTSADHASNEADGLFIVSSSTMVSSESGSCERSSIEGAKPTEKEMINRPSRTSSAVFNGKHKQKQKAEPKKR